MAQEIRSFREKYEAILEPWLKGKYKDVAREEIDWQPESGRKRVFKNPKEMAVIALNYFVERETAARPITYIGLILDMGLSSRSALDNYKKYKEHNNDFKSLIDTIKLVIQEKIECDLYSRDFRAAQFLLKTNYKYTEIITTISENKVYNIDVRDPNEDTD